MKVKANAKGQYKGVMYLLGDVFEIDKPADRAPWMGDVPEPPAVKAAKKGEEHAG